MEQSTPNMYAVFPQANPKVRFVGSRF